MTIRRAMARVFALLRARRLDDELDAEIQAHLELAEHEALASGMPPSEARRAARRHFGGIEQMKELHRDSRNFRWIETLLRDFRHGLASLARDPGFAFVAVSVLALGIGANVAMFSLVDAVFFKPVPFSDPDRIVQVWEAPRPGVTNSTSPLDFLDWRRMATEFEAIAAEQSISAALTGAGEPIRLGGKAVTFGYFRVFGIGARLGRIFTGDEDQPGAAPVVVLSHAAWRDYFGADPEILQRRPILDGEPHQVVGVLPPGVFDRGRAQFWKPLIFTPNLLRRDFHWLAVFGRLRDGVTLEQARARMQAIDLALDEVTPAFKRDWTIAVEPFTRSLVGDNLRLSILVAFGAVALVLLIACANVANLLLAKSAARRKELAVRAALGAGRGRLAAQLLTESAVLCLAGGAAGVALASLLIQAATPVLRQAIPFTAEVGLDWRVYTFAAGVALSVALAVGALPSLQLNFGKLAQSLGQSARGSSGAQAGLRRAITISEVALSVVLVCGALLLFRSLEKLQQAETGIRIENIITLSLDLPLQSYPAPESAALFYDAVARQLEGAPGVEQAALSNHVPLRWISYGEGLQVAGVDEIINVRLKRVDPGYFDTLGIPLLSGRGITRRDSTGAPLVVVINEVLAARLAEVAGISDPVGRRVSLSTPHYAEQGYARKDFEIVGVIRGERVTSPGGTAPPVAYVALAQAPQPSVKIFARTRAEPSAALPAIREAIRQVDADLPLGDIATMREVRDGTLTGTSRPAWLIGAFAFVAVLLAAIGLYGVLAHAVTQQRREIGIRMALGARPRNVMSQVIRGALSMIAVGLSIGLLGAFSFTRVMGNLLFGVSALDPLAFGTAVLSITAVGLLAAVLPASRAASIEPMIVLRQDG